MQVSAFDFELPDSLIAQEPPAVRGESRLLVLERQTGAVEHTTFLSLGRHLTSGDLLVVNDTRVFPARLIGRRVPSGGIVECLLLRQLPPPENHPHPHEAGIESPASATAPTAGSSQVWLCLMHPGQKLKPGARVVFEDHGMRLRGEVTARHFHGQRTIHLWSEGGIDVQTVIERIGHVPLPPYIAREDRASDRERYQTVYARAPGSVAAPTAGLHFTSELLAQLADAGVERAEITLHVGYGTFKPVRAERVENHSVDAERYVVSPQAAEALTRAVRDRRRVIAVGTTTARALESLAVSEKGVVKPAAGETDLFIRPGYEFRLVSALITNFHLPRSSLLMLVAAFGGREHILNAYRDAVSRKYRFYSYGDAMLIA